MSSKQWGHGHYTGTVDALKGAAAAVKQLQDRDMYAMAMVCRLMNTHNDKLLVEEVYQAIRKSERLNSLYSHAVWNGLSAGLFVDTHPPISKKSGLEALFAEARKNGWPG